MSSFCVIILAAGEGKRMKSDLPKVLCEIGDKPMVSHVVDTARSLSPKKIIVVVGHKKAQVKDALERDVKVVIQSKPLGTADAVRAAASEIPAQTRDCIVLYGDTPLIREETVRSLYDFHREKDVACTVLTAFLINPAGYGRILRNEAGQFVGIVEDKDASFPQRAIKEINTGMYVFKKDDLLEALQHVKPLNRAGEFYLTDVFAWFFKKNRKIEAYAADDFREVLGVNTPGDLMEAALCMRQRVLERHAAQGVCIVDAVTTFIDPSAQIGCGTRILPLTVIEKGVIVGRDCSLGPFCHLREGAVIKDGVSVGNFTEIKNSTLGEGTRMRHMSYLGDTQTGKKANIGAGLIVANFDGKKKHKTVIKDKAFLGCNAVLVAPVVIGKNAVVGAGSVVTRDHNVPDGTTVVGVPARPITKSKR